MHMGIIFRLFVHLALGVPVFLSPIDVRRGHGNGECLSGVIDVSGFA